MYNCIYTHRPKFPVPKTGLRIALQEDVLDNGPNCQTNPKSNLKP